MEYVCEAVLFQLSYGSTLKSPNWILTHEYLTLTSAINDSSNHSSNESLFIYLVNLFSPDTTIQQTRLLY